MASASTAKVVLITGCSDGGIGSSLAREFCMQGCRVFATARKLESMTSLVPLGVDILTLDVSKEESMTDAVNHVIETAGRIDVLVNNAGVPGMGALLDTPTMATIRNAFEVNVFGTLRLSQLVATHMVKQRSGTIANIGTTGAFGYAPFGSAYFASKAALHKCTHCMRVELRPFGVSVVLVTPGVVRSLIGHKVAASNAIPPGSLYSHCQHFIRSCASLTQGGMATNTDAFARGLVKQLLKGRPPRMVLCGAGAWAAWLASWMPLWLNDWILGLVTGLNKDPTA